MQASAADYALTSFVTPKRQLLTWTVIGLTTTKFNSLMLPMHDLSLSNYMYIWIYTYMILYDYIIWNLKVPFIHTILFNSMTVEELQIIKDVTKCV
jgi:hypothetical protein